MPSGGGDLPVPFSATANLPLRLYTGRLMFDRGTVQRESAVLPGLAPDPFAEIHPEDAGPLGIANGEQVLVTTAIGLFVAIPAVWMFNYFTNKVEAFDVEMDNSSSELIDYFLKRSGRARK